ncbi:MAG: hypothetical protein WD995_13465 [Gemmatimonadota bacterium]
MTNEVCPGRRRTPTALALAAALMTGLAACGADPFSFNWSDVPDTVSVYSLARPELNLPSAYNFFAGATLPVENPNATGNWDMALDTRGGELVLLPPGALGVQSRARIAALEGLDLDDVTEAPGDTLVFSSSDPVPLRLGTTYVVRTGQRAGSFGARCVYYAKMEPLHIDVAGGTLTFREVTNPVCNNRSLVPPR